VIVPNTDGASWRIIESQKQSQRDTESIGTYQSVKHSSGSYSWLQETFFPLGIYLLHRIGLRRRLLVVD
jgi:hypothetical protein